MQQRSIRNPFLRGARELIDIVLVVVVNIGVAIFLFKFAGERAEEFEPAIALAIPVITLAFISALLAVRGQNWSELGLRRMNWLSTLWQAGLIAAALFAVAYFTERAGLQRNLENLEESAQTGGAALAYQMLYALIVVGFYEEITFRGLVMNRFAHMFGASTGAWIIAALMQGALFGLAHMHQGLYGAFYTGGLSVLLALVFLTNGQNLWPLIIGHGVYDASRILSFSLAGSG
jgi:membrane protease YdiL (CAAX protease family)